MSSENSPETPHTPPAPNLSGFGRTRGSSLGGLVGGAPPSPAAVSPSPTAPPQTSPQPAPTAPERAAPQPAAATAPEPAPSAVGSRDTPPAGPPDLQVDVDDPTALTVSPTVLSVPDPLMRRFEKARRNADSNTELVLDALRAHLNELPQLVAQARRPSTAGGEGEPFPWRSTGRTGRRAAGKVHRVQLPIRPLAGELKVIDRLVGWVQEEIGAASRSLGGKTNRSEVVGAALDAYLPAERRGKSTIA